MKKEPVQPRSKKRRICKKWEKRHRDWVDWVKRETHRVLADEENREGPTMSKAVFGAPGTLAKRG